MTITINEIFLHLACHGQNFKILCSGIKTEINTGSVKEDDEDEGEDGTMFLKNDIYCWF